MKLLKEAEMGGFIRGIVLYKLIEGYDRNGDARIDWEEFKAAIAKIKKSDSYESDFSKVRLLLIYFTWSTTALKASGWFIAKSARTFLFSSIFLAFTFPIN